MNILRTATMIVAAGLVSFSLNAVPLPGSKVEAEPRYSEANVVDVFGTVETIREVGSGACLPGLHLAVRKDKRTLLDVYVGPSGYLGGFAVRFRQGDIVEAIGSKVRSDGTDVVLAREIRKNDSTVYLRDEHGTPLWSR